MKTEFLQLLEQVGFADVAPPGGLVVLSVGVMIALCLLVTAIVLVSFFVIRAIKKSQSPKPKDDA